MTVKVFMNYCRRGMIQPVNRGPIGEQGLGDRATDPGAGARDQCSPPRQIRQANTGTRSFIKRGCRAHGVMPFIRQTRSPVE